MMTNFPPHSTPEREGIPSSALTDFYRFASTIEHLHGLTIFRHGRIVAEGIWRPYQREVPQQLFFCRVYLSSSSSHFRPSVMWRFQYSQLWVPGPSVYLWG